MTRRWILVENPPLERQGASCQQSRFYARRVMMGADHGAVDHLKLVGRNSRVVQGIQDVLESQGADQWNPFCLHGLSVIS